MQYLTVIAKITAKPNSVELVLNELKKLVEPTLKEKGCIDYRLFQDNDDPRVFLFYENWETSEYLDMHMNSIHFRNCFNKIDNLISTEVHKATKM